MRIDKLEIELGDLEMEALSSPLLKHLILEAVEAQISRLETGKRSGNADPIGAESQFVKWLFFLEHGRLPWNGLSVKNPIQIEAVMERLSFSYTALQQFKALLWKMPLALERLVLQHEPKQLKTLFAICVPSTAIQPLQLAKEANQVINIAKQIDSQPFKAEIKPKNIVSTLWKWAFQRVFVQANNCDAADLACRNSPA